MAACSSKLGRDTSHAASLDQIPAKIVAKQTFLAGCSTMSR
jgi:hypothetical protein